MLSNKGSFPVREENNISTSEGMSALQIVMKHGDTHASAKQ